MLLTMTRVQIIGTRDCLNRTLQCLHRLGVVQVEDLTQLPYPIVQPLAPDVVSLQDREESTFLLTRLQAILGLLTPQPLPPESAAQYDILSTQPADELVAQVRDQLDQLAPETQNLATRRDELEAERISLPRYESLIQKLTPLAAELPELTGFEVVALLIERRFKDVLDLVRQELSGITRDQFELIARDVDAETTAALLVFPRRHSAGVQSLLAARNINQVRLPTELTEVPFKNTLATIARRKTEITAELAAIDQRCQRLSQEWYATLAVWQAALHDRQQELEVRSRLGATQYTFVIVGWAPRRDLASLCHNLEYQVGPTVVVEELPVTREELEQAPVALDNPAPLRPFEFLVKLLALPRYGTLDPTPLMALFLPLFFGMILGDVAYGLLVVGLAAWVVRRYPDRPGLNALGRVLLVCGFWSIVFGILFGEFLGGLGEHFGLHPLWINRAENLTAILIFAISVGVIQIVLGLVLGAFQALQHRRVGELSQKTGTLIALTGVFLLVGILADLMPGSFMTPAAAALIVGLVLLSAPLGPVGLFLGPIELLGTIGNVLSYLRIAAIGLASVYLADVANQLGGLIGNVLLGGIVATLFHALNLALGILSPTIQSMRLHYVEFFTKFFESGGQAFTPFRRQGLKAS
jgi:V/A-type H+-transporting ATPase subunit I